ncbi:MAG: ABC transporter substrate-binding protein, partial [Pseudolabrys sp.]
MGTRERTMTNSGITRRSFGLSSFGAVVAGALPGILPNHAYAADTVRHGVQIGGLGALRTTLPDIGKKYDITYDLKDFRDSTSVLLALEQGELEVGNTTTQHLIRAISEGIPVTWICGWGGGYNVVVARKGLDLKPNDDAALKSLILEKKKAGKPLSIAAPSGSINHQKMAIFLKSMGIDPEKDVQFANVPYPNHSRALEAAEVDMAVAIPIFAALSITKGDAFFVKHLFGGKFGKQEIGFIVPRKLIAEKADLVQRIVNSH